jgi:hypothetical protein
LLSGKRPLRIPRGIPLGEVHPHALTAGHTGTLSLTVKLGEPLVGEEIVLLSGGHRWVGLMIPIQGEDPSSDGYVSCSILDGPDLPPVDRGKPEKLGDLFRTSWKIPEGGIPKGSVLQMVVGDTSEGGSGIEAPGFATPDVFFALLLEPRPDSLERHKLNWICAFVFDIVGGPLHHLRALAPSVVGTGEEFSITVRPQDSLGNISPEKPDRLELDVDNLSIEVDIGPDQINPAGAIEIPGLSIANPGIFRAVIGENGRRTVSNPIIAGDIGQNLYWGLLHEHTELSDGVGSLDSCYVNMRHGSRLDFGATSDHDHRFETTDEMFEMTREAARRYYEPGIFTTFLGYEWAKWRRNGDGDRNVYYLKDDGEFFRSQTGELDRPDKLFEALKGHDSIVIPHHTAYEGNFCDWSQHDPEIERLVEIYSVFGSSERSAEQGNPYPVRTGQLHDPRWVKVSGEKPRLAEYPPGFVQEGLGIGWKVGFTGGGDKHCSHPGDDVRSGFPPLNYKPGLTGVWSGRNCREEIWRSLRERRCFATTGARMLLRMSVNGHPMGSEFNMDGGGKRSIHLTASGTDNISSVELVRNNEVFAMAEPGQLDVKLHWIDRKPFDEVALPSTKWSKNPFIFYYLRVRQVDGEMGWTSPVWVEMG